MATSYDECIDACNACADACEKCATACLAENDLKMMVDCIRLDRDCADACRLAAALMSRGSQFARQFCDLCAALCDACGQECEKHRADHCQRCAAACRACAQQCRRMPHRFPLLRDVLLCSSRKPKLVQPGAQLRRAGRLDDYLHIQAITRAANQHC